MGKFDNCFIISDIDHTFLANNSTVPQNNLDALDYFKSEGGKFTFATGRSHSSETAVICMITHVIRYLIRYILKKTALLKSVDLFSTSFPTQV